MIAKNNKCWNLAQYWEWRCKSLKNSDMKQTDKKHLTAENGRPIADNENTQTAGMRGPVTMQDP